MAPAHMGGQGAKRAMGGALHGFWGFEAWGLGFWVWGLGLRVRVRDLGLRV